MDAPPTQYRVIERNGKLIVLDARTNLPPKKAADFHPGRAMERMPERVSAQPFMEESTATQEDTSHSTESDVPAHLSTSDSAEGLDHPDRFERLANSFFFSKADRDEDAQLTPFKVGVFGFAVFMVLAISIGGFTGFLIGAMAIIIAGNLAMKARHNLF